ncbi:MAG TPA: hypothetical protein DCS07_06230, partial [Bdellovibrionales bacterium]|nr:hypothetical protein [Bdellovibrionales bacterium]
MKKILAIKIRAMGDTVLLTAPLAELRRAYPDAEIHVLVDRCWAPLLEHSPVANRIWGLERRATRLGRLQTLSSLARQLRRERFDLVINFHASTSSAFLSRATGAQVRSIHFHGLKDPNLFSTVLVPGKGQVKPVIERDMDALRALGLSIPEGVYPRLAVTEDEKSRALAHLASIHLTGPVLG